MFGNSSTPPFPPCPDSGGEGWGVGECICHPALSAPGCYCSSLHLYRTVRKYIYVIQTFYLHLFLPLNSVCTMNTVQCTRMYIWYLHYVSTTPRLLLFLLFNIEGGSKRKRKAFNNHFTDLSVARILALEEIMEWNGCKRAVSIILYPISPQEGAHNLFSSCPSVLFKLVYSLSKIRQNFGLFWPILAILLQIYALFGVLLQALIKGWCTKIDK